MGHPSPPPRHLLDGKPTTGADAARHRDARLVLRGVEETAVAEQLEARPLGVVVRDARPLDEHLGELLARGLDGEARGDVFQHLGAVIAREVAEPWQARQDVDEGWSDFHTGIVGASGKLLRA